MELSGWYHAPKETITIPASKAVCFAGDASSDNYVKTVAFSEL